MPELFRLVLEGKKNFEVRLADFKCEEGDTLILEEWAPKKNEYTKRSLKEKVKLVLKTKDMPFWKEEYIKKFGYRVIGFD